VFAPLAGLTSTIDVPWKWGKEQSKAFLEAKKNASEETLLAHPAHDEPFMIHTDASHQQLGAIILQDCHPIVFCRKKSNDVGCSGPRVAVKRSRRRTTTIPSERRTYVVC
jgi:hypothetical protein